ncbi:uncharacterized protein LOC102358923 [Latimeria chalumnae]|uniref:uncharacterized protein LOC102358923 n=1 Tax=Latimeria chalumnae TaxID=7897 RepID=UPI0003C19493|nr:PREDICTED: uncharacterized protein LOC102358923 [Latimeria chalumnae]XP_014340437.1 PREDICTED: uncharacterized protein LOC102358923 [Latimeria chalumnae]|eukprot:XP_005989988.1 PREDICTED: uncharacterized protein LOC102358923 [Latimeria chalumnae]
MQASETTDLQEPPVLQEKTSFVHPASSYYQQHLSNIHPTMHRDQKAQTSFSEHLSTDLPHHHHQQICGPRLCLKHQVQWPQQHTPPSAIQEGETHLPLLLVTLPGLKSDDQRFPSNIYVSLSRRLQHAYPEELNLKQKHHEKTENLNGLGASQLLVNNPVQKYIFNHQDPKVCQDIRYSKRTAVIHSYPLPEEVSLDDALKMFDCTLVNNRPETISECQLYGSQIAAHNVTCKLDFSKGRKYGMIQDGKPPGSGLVPSVENSHFKFIEVISSKSLNSLQLPHELLSADYEVPETADAVSTMDYFYNVSTYDGPSEELCSWHKPSTGSEVPRKDTGSMPKRVRESSEDGETTAKIFYVASRPRNFHPADREASSPSKIRVVADAAFETLQELLLESMSPSIKQKLGI